MEEINQAVAEVSAPELKEFHFGIRMEIIMDVRIDAVDAEDAQAKFKAASETQSFKQYPQRELERGYEVLGMCAGPLPEPVEVSPENAHEATDAVH
jgi:hypothetical protein